MFYKGMAMLIAIVWSWRSADLHAQVNGDPDVLWARIAPRLKQPGAVWEVALGVATGLTRGILLFQPAF